MKIVATNIGERKEINWKGKHLSTGIFKFPVSEGIFLNKEEVKGDAICDRKHHGGIDQAVYGYSQKHYAYWKALYPSLDWQYGMFGENLTIDDLEETTLHEGATFQVGNAVIEVTTFREPCMKLGVRFNDMKIVKQFWNTTMSGAYFKVLEQGFVKQGDVFVQLKSGATNPTIASLYNTKKGLL